MFAALEAFAHIFHFCFLFLGLGVWSLVVFRIKPCSFFNGLGISFAIGLLVNISLHLILPSLETVKNLEYILAGLGYLLFLYSNRRTIAESSCRGRSCLVGGLLFSLFCILLLCFLQGFEPISHWDSRSIWFFHSRIIYHAQSVLVGDLWKHEALSFSHADYTKMFPLMGAQIANYIGNWNEYTPRDAGVLLMIPAVFMILAIMQESFFVGLFFLITCVTFPNFEIILFSGFLDGFFAIYAAISVFYLSRWIQAHASGIRSEQTHFILFVLCLGLCAALKNEAILLLASVAVVLGVYTVYAYIRRTATCSLSNGLFCVFCIVPYLLWSFWKAYWSIENDLQLVSIAAFKRGIARIADMHAHEMILEKMFFGVSFFTQLIYVEVVLLILLLLQGKLFEKKWKMLPLSVVIPLIIVTFYWCGLYAVYLMTPYDLNWHLVTSADRTMIGVALLLSSACVTCMFHSYEAARSFSLNTVAK